MKRKYILSVILLTSFTALASGQALRGSYFFETSLIRGHLNPAFAPQSNYVSVPVIGNLGIESYSNVGLANFLFPSGNKNYLFLNDNVTTDQFLSGLPADNPYLNERLEFDVLGAGFRLGQAGFLSIGLSVVENGAVKVPVELLRFAKTGGNASIQGIDVNAGAYAQLAVGYSYDLSEMVEGLHLGGRVKLLTGITAAEVHINQLSIQTGTNAISASSSGDGYLAGGIDYTDGKFATGKFGLSGIGFAVDLGVEYQLPLEGFINGVNLSASVCDLGVLSFNKSVEKLSANGSASFSGLQGIDENYDFGTNLDRVIEDFTNLTQFKATSADKYGYKISPTLYAGVDAPFLNNMMSVGLLYSYRLGFSNLMASYNVTPVRWFNFNVNYTFVGPARTFGFYAEFIPKKAVGLFLGMNTASFKTNSKGLGISNMTESACLGLNVIFGSK